LEDKSGKQLEGRAANKLRENHKIPMSLVLGAD